MEYVRIELSPTTNILDSSITPTITIEPDGSGYRVNLSFGIRARKATAPPTPTQVTSQREASTGVDLFDSASASMTLTAITGDAAGSVLTFGVKAKLGTKVPGTGSSTLKLVDPALLEKLFS